MALCSDSAPRRLNGPLRVPPVPLFLPHTSSLSSLWGSNFHIAPSFWMVAKMLYSMHNCSGGRTTHLENSAKINVNNSIHLTRCKGGFMLHPAKPYFRPSLRTEVEIGIRENVGCFRPSSDQSSYEWSLAILLSGITFAFFSVRTPFHFPPMFPPPWLWTESCNLFLFGITFTRLECTLHRNFKMCIFCFYFALFCLT